MELIKKKKNDWELTYKEKLINSGLFFPGPTKGSFILPEEGLVVWENIKKELDKRLFVYGIKNVALPTVIPLSFFQKELDHFNSFAPEFFFVQKKNDQELLKKEKWVLRPTSEVLFYHWFQQILSTYRQLPFLFNQWSSVFRAEKNTQVFLRSTEFFWQEGHAVFQTEEEAQKFTLNIFWEYKNYVKNVLNLAVVWGKKSEEEKFLVAIETYTIECLLPDNQSLQIFTIHFFGNRFCRSFAVKFLDPNNLWQFPFSVSWGMSTRVIGAIVKLHSDEWGVVLPFLLAPIQIAFILLNNKEEEKNYQKQIEKKLATKYRCFLYKKNRQFSKNLKEADEKGCPLKIIIGPEEVNKKTITLIKRNDLKKKIVIEWTKTKIFQKVRKEIREFSSILYKRSQFFLKKKLYSIKDLKQLKKKIVEKKGGFFRISFCNQINCEKNIKKIIPLYSIRCVENNWKKEKKCLFCHLLTKNKAIFGKSV